MTFRLDPPRNRRLDLDGLASRIYSAVFSDICDRLGMREQTAAPGIRHLAGRREPLIGWARTAVSLPVEAPPARHYGNEIDYLDSLREGDVAVIDCSRSPAAVWGELFSTASTARGARGAVIDGLIRDSRKIDALGFPVYGRGMRPTDSLGRVSIAEADVTISVGGVAVRSGDLIVADGDGVTVVPQERAGEVVTLAIEKASIENKARDLLLGGARLADAWERFGVL